MIVFLLCETKLSFKAKQNIFLTKQLKNIVDSQRPMSWILKIYKQFKRRNKIIKNYRNKSRRLEKTTNNEDKNLKLKKEENKKL